MPTFQHTAEQVPSSLNRELQHRTASSLVALCSDEQYVGYYLEEIIRTPASLRLTVRRVIYDNERIPELDDRSEAVDDDMSDEERGPARVRARTFAGAGGCRPDRSCGRGVLGTARQAGSPSCSLT